MSKTAPIILDERDDGAIDKLLTDATYGPGYIVSVDISRKGGGGNLTPKLRSGIQCPLVRVKTVAQALVELVTGGGQLRIDVFHASDATGNKARLLQPWWEAFTDPPRIGEPYNSLTIAWNDTGGENGDGAWEAVPRAGTNARNQQTYEHASTAPAGGFGPVIAGPRVAQAPDFPVVMRGLNGETMPPPPNMIPASLRGYPASAQWQMLAAQHEKNYGVRPSLEPVDIMSAWKNEAKGEVGDLRADKVRIEERYEGLRDRSRNEVEQANKRVAELEKRVAEGEARHQRELEAAQTKAREDRLQAQIAQLAEKIANPTHAIAPQKTGLAALDPNVMITMINGFVSMQNAAAERNNTMMLALLKPTPTAPPKSLADEIVPLLAAITPLAAPLMTQWLANTSPAARAELEESRNQQNQVLYSMVMQHIQQLVPANEEPPIWYGPLMTVINGMMGAVQTAAMSAGANRLPALPMQQAQQVEQRVVETAAPAPAPAPTAPIEATVEQEPVSPADMPIAPPPVDLERQIDHLATVSPYAGVPATMTRLVMRTAGARGIHQLLTPEWTSIVFAIHHRDPAESDEDRDERIAELVPDMVDHLEHCRKFSLLPGPLAEVFEKPELLDTFVQVLPIYAMDGAYAMAFVEELKRELVMREKERKKAMGEPNEELDDDEDDESGETELEGDEDDDDDEEESDDEVAGGPR